VTHDTITTTSHYLYHVAQVSLTRGIFFYFLKKL